MIKRDFSSYALLGAGRLANHLSHYLRLLDLPVIRWSRNGDALANTYSDPDPDVRLHRVRQSASHLLLAVSDAGVAELAPRMPADRVVVHFSGALAVEGVACAHPLMTFGGPLMDLTWYQEIPFVLDRGSQFSDLLPGLPNPHHHLNPDQRPYYHALCSLAGNATYLLWRQIGAEFERELNLPRARLGPFLLQNVENAVRAGSIDVTGPAARADWQVVQSHLRSLARSPDLLMSYRQYLKSAASAGHAVPEELL